MISVSKLVLEFLLVVLGLMTAVATGVFSFATYKHHLATSKLKLDVMTAHSNLSTAQTKFAVKMQQNVDNLRVELGIAKCDIRDIKGALKCQGTFFDRASFPESSIPESTGWDIKE